MSKIKEFFQNLVRTGVISKMPANEDAATLKVYIDYLEAENEMLYKRWEKSIELPFFQQDGEAFSVFFKTKYGVVCAETYFADVYYDGMRGCAAAEKRFAELKGERSDL